MHADVTIIGAGPVGTSIAWHLATRGCTSVVVLERAPRVGEGSAAVATGGFRLQFGTAVNIGLSLLARQSLLRFADEVGGDPGFQQVGYLFLAYDDAQMQALRDGVALQRRCGVAEATLVTPSDAAALNPHVRMDGVVGGSFCPSDGFIRPVAMTRAWANAARRLGVEFEFDCGNISWEVDRSPARTQVRAVSTASRRLTTSHLIVAAGAWSGLLSGHGIAIPVQPERRQIAVTQPFDELPANMPMTIDCSDGFHLRVRDGRVLLLRPDPTAGTGPLDTRFDSSWLPGLLDTARRRVPCLERARIDLDQCRCGLYEMTPDKHALVGSVPEIEGLWLATGNSGHGVMHAAAIGKIMAEMILDGGAQSLDARPLRPSRFAEGEPNEASGVL